MPSSQGPGSRLTAGGRTHPGRSPVISEEGEQTHYITRRIKAPFAWKRSCFSKSPSLISASSEAGFKFYVFRSFSILHGLLSHFTGQFSDITPQSWQPLEVGEVKASRWMWRRGKGCSLGGLGSCTPHHREKPDCPTQGRSALCAPPSWQSTGEAA